MSTNGGEMRWQDALYEQLRAADVTIFAHVPDAGHRVLIDRSIADPDATSVPLTSEQEGVGIAAGAHLGGARAVLMMQSSGVGNCINQLSLIQHGAFPFLTIVSMRGEFGEGNPWQFAMGKAVEPTLSAMGVQCLWAHDPVEVETVTTAALTMAFRAERAVAVMLSQRLLGAKAF
ncbi:MAG: phosphonopyruvate decarboxylase [Pseudomonadota bacterium]